MKFLILGASGLVGWNLMGAAGAAGHETVGTYHQHPQPGLVPLDVKEPNAVARIFEAIRPDAVFYCSGWTWVDGCEGDRERAFRENAEFPAHAAQQAEKIGAQFVYFSTSYVFDGTAGPYGEDDKVCPLSAYGHSKLEGEKGVLNASGRAIIARTMGVYGPEPQEKNFVYQVRRNLAAGKSMLVPNDQFGNATYAPDLAAMAIELVRQGQRGIWNLAGPDPGVRRSEFARRIAQSYGLPLNLIEPCDTASLRQPAPRPLNAGLKIDKVIQAATFVPRSWVKI